MFYMLDLPKLVEGMSYILLWLRAAVWFGLVRFVPSHRLSLENEREVSTEREVKYKNHPNVFWQDIPRVLHIHGTPSWSTHLYICVYVK